MHLLLASCLLPLASLTWLVEDPLPIWLAGAVLLTLVLVMYLQLRSRWMPPVMVAIVLVVVLLTVIEQVVRTPREQVERALNKVAAAVEANDLTGTLALIAPRAHDVRTDAETLMSRLKISKARVTDRPIITIDQEDSPQRATAKFRGLVQVAENRSGLKGVYYDDLEVQFVREGEKWLVRNYTPTKPWSKNATTTRRKGQQADAND